MDSFIAAKIKTIRDAAKGRKKERKRERFN